MANYTFIGGDGKSYGPYTVDQMRQFMAQNRLTAQSQVSADGGAWQPAGSCPELMGGAGAYTAGQQQAVQPPMAGAMPMHQNFQKPHRGVLILVLGILSIVLCGFFTGIPAWVMGNNDLKEMEQGIMDPSGRGMTQAGRIIGMIITILGCGCGSLYGILMIIAAASGA